MTQKPTSHLTPTWFTEIAFKYSSNTCSQRHHKQYRSILNSWEISQTDFLYTNKPRPDFFSRESSLREKFRRALPGNCSYIQRVTACQWQSVDVNALVFVAQKHWAPCCLAQAVSQLASSLWRQCRACLHSSLAVCHLHISPLLKAVHI